MLNGKDKVAKELQDYSKEKLDEAVINSSEEEIVAALENYNKSMEATSKDQDIYPMPALEMGKKAAAAIGSIGGIYLAGVSLNQEDTVSRSDEDNLMRSMMSFNVGTIAVGAAAAVALGAAWGAARIGYEAAKQFNNYGDANIRGSLTTSMNALNSLEEKHFSTDNPAFTLLKELEKEIIEEGHVKGVLN